jgi:hypothetical protein
LQRGTIVIIDMDLSMEEAWALALYLRRIGPGDCGGKAADGDEARLMFEAVQVVRQALVAYGIDPR